MASKKKNHSPNPMEEHTPQGGKADDGVNSNKVHNPLVEHKEDIVPPDISIMQQYLSRDYTALALCLFIVDSPIKEGSFFSKEISYRILVKTSLESYNTRKFYVRRTFDDIKWLKSQLVEQFPHCIIPPLHDPKTFTQSETNEKLSKIRRRTIQRFMNRVGSHPTLAKSKVLRFFLTFEGKTYKETKTQLDDEIKNKKKKIQQHKGSKFFSPSDLSQQDGATRKDMNSLKKEAEALYKTFRALHKSSRQILESRSNHEAAFEQFEKMFQKFGSSSKLRYPGSNIDTKSLIDLLIIFHATMGKVNTLNAEFSDLEADSLYEILKDFTMYTREVILYTERYEAWRFIFFETKLFLDAAIHKELKLHPPSTFTNPELLDEETPTEATPEKPSNPLIKETEQLLEEHSKQLDAFIFNRQTERAWFDSFRAKEIMYWTNYYSNMQISVHKKMIKVWQSYIDEFNEHMVVNSEK